jgi:mRNA-degrading endonuclease RelE of RelBE toxin-antitoxin system
VNLEVRYARSFLQDLKSLEPAAYEQVYNFVFVELGDNWLLHSLPEIRQLGDDGIFY